MQDLSFDPKDPIFICQGLSYSIQIFTFENIYGLDPQMCTIQEDPGIQIVTCSGLTWAAGQETAAGTVTVRVQHSNAKTVFTIHAQAQKTIRCVKLILKDLPIGPVVSLRESEALPVPEQGLILSYPDGWRGLYTPLVITKTEEQSYLFFRSLDSRVHTKKFVFLPHNDRMDVELIYEQLVIEQDTSITVPDWEFGVSTTPEALYREQVAHIETAYHLVPWEERSDVPAWAREIALVAAIHCQHETGFIFNDYDQILESIKWIAECIDPRRVLVYLPGWEGRYYWQYGDYRPDPRMGGEAGFRILMQEANAIGVHMMPMFGINLVNASIENYEQWGAPATGTSPGGYAASGSVDWDSSRHYDHGWGRMLNPGAPTWQNRLFGQITRLIDTYGFDAVFLDISAAWWNDPHHDVAEGTHQLIQKIRAGRVDLLVAGEGWYDSVGGATPLMQSGHTDGVLHWHDVPYPELFDRHNRMFAHLCLGDPGRGSTGVHELGYNPIQRCPIRKGIIPTVTLVEDTLQRAPEQVLCIIEDARLYVERYLRASSIEKKD